MKNLRNGIVICLVILGLTTSALFLVNWRKARSYRNLVKIPEIKADLEVGNLFLTEEKEGTILWELKARIAQSFDKGGKTLLEDLRVTLYERDGRTVTLKGDRGRIDDKTRDIEVEGGILVTSSDGLSLRTHSLQYKHEQREITSKAPVRIDRKGIRISGVGLLMDLASERISILEGVESLIYDVPFKSG